MCVSSSACVFVGREMERIMGQSYTRSFVLPPKSLLRNQGSLTQYQFPVKQTQNYDYENSMKNPFHERKTVISCKSSKSNLPNYVYPSEHEDGHVGSIQRDFHKHLNILCRFMRPYSTINNLIAITSISLLPLESVADLSLPFFVGLFKALMPSSLMNLYGVGLNQLTDVEIDKVNKPYLSLPSGEISMESGKAITSIFLLMSLALGIMFQSPPLLVAIAVRFLMLTAYSVELPLLRWKRNAFLSASCILIPRAADNVAAFIHIQKFVLRRPIVFTRSLVFAVAFMGLFSTIISLSKDIPDVDGDRAHGVQSLAVIFGKDKVYWLCVSMLLIGYGSAMLFGASSSFLPSKLVIVLGHGALASSLWFRARSVDLDSNASINSFYMFIWKLVYAEYLLIPFVR